MVSEKFFDGMLWVYRVSLEWVLENPLLTLIVLILTIALNAVLVIYNLPKRLFPPSAGYGCAQSTAGSVQGPQDASFASR